MGDYFTADDHFGHRNIITHCNRPFSTVHHMNLGLSERWNDRIGPDDVVYHLSDFALTDLTGARDFFAHLNGRIRILANWWHHDKKWLYFLRDVDRWDCVDELWPVSASGHQIELLEPLHYMELPMEYAVEGRARGLTLCHYPMSRWERRHYNSWHFFGHSHGRFAGEGLSMDVGVDATVNYFGVPAYAPMRLDECAKILREKQHNYEAASRSERNDS